MATRSSKGRGGGPAKSRSSRKSASSSSRKAASSRSRKSQDESDRYRRAADDALQQLDWAIGYLHGIKKTEISKALAQNRTYIRRNLMGEADEALPDQKTDET
jgi:hypothetical protein